MMLRRCVPHAALLALALGGAAMWSTPAHADTLPASEASAAQAASYYQQGNAEFEKKNWPGAEAAYVKAWAITRTFDVAANLGEVEFHLGKMRETAEYLSYSLRTAPPSSKPAQRERTTHFLELAKEHLCVLRIRVNVEGATVSINGKALTAEDAAHEVFVDPGTYTVVASRAGYAEGRRTIEAAAGKSSEAAVALVALPATLPPKKKSVIPTVLLGIGSAAGLGVGVAMTLVSNGKSSDAVEQRTTILNAGGQCVKPGSAFLGACQDMKGSLHSLDVTANAARVAYAASGLLLIGALTYALIPQPTSGSSGWIRISPAVGSTGGGLGVQGAW